MKGIVGAIFSNEFINEVEGLQVLVFSIYGGGSDLDLDFPHASTTSNDFCALLPFFDEEWYPLLFVKRLLKWRGRPTSSCDS